MPSKFQPKLPLLAAFEQAPRKSVRVWMAVLLVLAGLWVVADWALRFALFHWQDGLVTRGSGRSAASGEMEPTSWAWKTIASPARLGGGLSVMFPLAWARRDYEEFHEAFSWFNGPDGYIWGTSEARADKMRAMRHFDAVLVGDSCWVSAGTQTVSEVLGDLTGKVVLNRGRPGGGPFLALRWWAEHAWRDGLSADVVVWDISAREIGAPLFKRQDVAAWFQQVQETPGEVYGERETSAFSAVHWDALNPRSLERSLPNTSMTAYFSRKAWACARLMIGIWPQDVFGGEDRILGPTLYYRYNELQLKEQTQEGDVPVVAAKVMDVDKAFAERGTKLLVVLVPEKEQVADGGLSPERRDALAESLEVMRALERELEAGGVAVVNLLDPFREATARGERLFWRDDPHWNDAGMRFAARQVAQELGWKELGP